MSLLGCTDSNNDSVGQVMQQSGEGPADVHAATGIMVGDVGTDRALVQLRLSSTSSLVDGDLPGSEGVVEFTLVDEDGDIVQRLSKLTIAEFDYIARVSFKNLKRNTRYRCKTRIGVSERRLLDGPTAEFRTLAGAELSREVSFVVVTGMNYEKFHGNPNYENVPEPYAGPDKPLGYPALASILARRPDFFVGTGDNVYYDSPKPGRAETISEMRRRWHEQFIQPRFRDLFAKVPTYWEIDDHDFRADDSDLTGDYFPTPDEGRRIMLEQLPYAAHEEESPRTYRTRRVTKELQIWFVENRLYRSPNSMDDGPEKSIWGSDQREWLKKTLLESDADFKVLVSPTPMIGPDDRTKIDNHSNVGGFQFERNEFFTWIKANNLDKKGFIVICGDRHWQYHSIFPNGLEEFSSGALVDANARLGRVPGDPESTDPDALIEQPYMQNPASGGFLMVTVTPASDQSPTMTLRFFDELGKTLHEHSRVPKM